MGFSAARAASFNKPFKHVAEPIEIDDPWYGKYTGLKWEKSEHSIGRGSNYGKESVDLGAVGPDTSRATPLVTAAVSKLMEWHLNKCEPGEVKTGEALVNIIKDVLINKCVKTSNTLAGKLLTGGYLDETKLATQLSSSKESVICRPSSVDLPASGLLKV
ncbi:hypothetical protein [uncultured Desulfobacter sp.]|uniref:hypothetical protein n=1 Tax=uncultured Desulfobacter sp. TaxID=240139 RepID=UPI002AA7D795|nr:hypothetical protein [uncultured Desulfobacter sp.]